MYRPSCANAATGTTDNANANAMERFKFMSPWRPFGAIDVVLGSAWYLKRLVGV
jgi:hypothetical protein